MALKLTLNRSGSKCHWILLNAFQIILIGLFMLASTSAAIPFLVIYEVMVLMHILKGIGGGLLDAGLYDYQHDTILTESIAM